MQMRAQNCMMYRDLDAFQQHHHAGNLRHSPDSPTGMHVEAWGLNHSLYLPYVMHGRPSVAASFSLRPQDSLWDGAHHARLTGDVVGEILGGKVDRADWSVAPDDPGTGARPRHKLSH